MANTDHRHPRSSKQISSNEPRFMNPNPQEHTWIRTIPEFYPDIMRAPAVIYKAERDLARISSNTYIAYQRPYRGKQGLLLIGKDQRPVIIDETDASRPKILPMRLDREAIHSTWIFSITIYPTEGLIQMEDCIAADGAQIRSTKTFKERYAILQTFTDTIWCQDTRFQLNWQIQLAQMHSLENVRALSVNCSNTGGSLCLMPDLPSLRLIKVLPQPIVAPVCVGGPTEYLCIRIIGKPDVYDLKTLAGKDIGRASIQTLTCSQALQQKRATGQPLRVLAEWNEEFESHVVTSVL